MRPEVTTSEAHRTRRTVIGFGIAAVLSGAAIFAGMTAGAAYMEEIGYMEPETAYKAALAGEIILIDIRRPDEWLSTSVGEGAIGLDMLEDNFLPILAALRHANPDMPIALICRTGNRTGNVTRALAKQGFTGLVDVSEGMEGGDDGPGWLRRGVPTYAGTATNVTTRTNAVMKAMLPH